MTNTREDPDEASILMTTIGSPENRLSTEQLVDLNRRKGRDRVKDLLSVMEERGDLEQDGEGRWKFTASGREKWDWLWEGKETLNALHRAVERNEERDRDE
jgi:hypothetical protein